MAAERLPHGYLNPPARACGTCHPRHRAAPAGLRARPGEEVGRGAAAGYPRRGWAHCQTSLRLRAGTCGALRRAGPRGREVAGRSRHERTGVLPRRRRNQPSRLIRGRANSVSTFGNSLGADLTSSRSSGVRACARDAVGAAEARADARLRQRTASWDGVEKPFPCFDLRLGGGHDSHPGSGARCRGADARPRGRRITAAISGCRRRQEDQPGCRDWSSEPLGRCSGLRPQRHGERASRPEFAFDPDRSTHHRDQPSADGQPETRAF